MLTATRKHHSMVRGLCRFAQVSVCRPEPHETDICPSEPEILLNGHSTGARGESDNSLIAAALEGVRRAEADSGWRGPLHSVLKIEGLAVDGIDFDAARLAAQVATKALIQL